MNQVTTFFLCLLLGLITQQSTAQILYSEDFEGTNNTMPTAITIIDGDVSPANAAVAAFDQWVLIESFRTLGDTVAAVTSYLDPAGQSDDWLITPQVAGITANTNLSWEAAAVDPAFRDGYQVWVTSTIAGTTPVISDFTTGGTLVFSIAAEDTLFTAHTVSLGAFAGQSVYVGFRNNSNDQYVLGLDDILIEAVAAPSLAATFVETPASCGNANGSVAMTATGGTAPYTYLWDAAANNQTTATATNLAAGTYGLTITDATGAFITGTATVSASALLNIYSEDFEGTGGVIPAGMTVIDADAASAVAGLVPFDQWIVVNSAETVNVDSVAAVTSYLDPAGQSDDWLITPQVAGIDASTILSWEAVARDPDFRDGYQVWATSTIAGTTPTTTDFTTGGTLLVTIAAEDTIFTARSVSLGAFAGQSVYVAFRNNSNDMFILEVDDISIDKACTAAALSATTSAMDANCGNANGSASVMAVGGAAPYTYLWSNSQTTATISGLVAGTYTVTVTDNAGTLAIASALINNNAATVNIYSEDFEGTGGVIPAGMTVIDADAAPAVAGLVPFDQWIVVNSAETVNVDSVAAVTSYLDPAGQSDDWLITPQVAGIDATSTLSWEAVARDPDFRDGYQVWATSAIAGTTPTTTDFTVGGTLLVTIAAEDTLFTARSVSLSAFAGQSVYVAFRNNSNDMFILEVDDISIDNSCPSSTMTVATTVINATCGNNNGSITATPTGGAAPYTYLWSNNQTTATATNLAPGTYMVTVSDAGANNVVVQTATVSGPATVVVASASVTSNYNGADVSCFGSADGEATVVATGGTLPYTYLWGAAAGNQTSSVATGLAAGVYPVTVTDNNGCTSSLTVTVTEPTVIVVTITNNGGGTATASATGGTAAYTYLWSNNQTTATATGLMASTTYTVTVTDVNGCQSTGSFTTGGANVAATTTSTATTCGLNNGTATVVATGGTLPYTYLWDANAASQITATATNLAGGAYSVTVIDATGSVAVATTIVTTSIALGSSASVVSNYNGSDISCFGAADGEATAVAIGGSAPYTYFWDANAGGQTTATAAGLAAGTYNVTITDANGCTDANMVTVVSPTVVMVNAVGNGNGTATATATGGTGSSYTYLWSNAQTTATATGLMNGTTYFVTATDVNGCTGTDSVNTTFINVTNLNLSEQVSVYPTPATSTIWVKFDLAAANTVNIRLMSVLGQEVLTRQLQGVNATTVALPTEQLPAGVYLLTVEADDRQSTFKVVIK